MIRSASSLSFSLIGLGLLLAGPVAAQETPNCENAMTQSEMTQCANIDWLKADAELNAVYRSAMEKMTETDAYLPEGLKADCNRDLISQVLVNLIENALKYGRPETGDLLIRLGGREEDGRIVLSVTDNGPGIEPQHLPRLTERFYRVDAGRQASTGGTGLGLAIVKHCLEHHEGELDITSTPGEGSTFTCRFPAQRALDRRAA